MLKKELCKRCWNKTDILKSGQVVRVFEKGWIEFDEGRWEVGGIVYCPLIYLGERENIFRYIKEKPPKYCPYYLENIL